MISPWNKFIKNLIRFFLGWLFFFKASIVLASSAYNCLCGSVLNYWSPPNPSFADISNRDIVGTAKSWLKQWYFNKIFKFFDCTLRVHWSLLFLFLPFIYTFTLICIADEQWHFIIQPWIGLLQIYLCFVKCPMFKISWPFQVVRCSGSANWNVRGILFPGHKSLIFFVNFRTAYANRLPCI